MIYAGIFVASLTLANLLVAWFGPWFSPINAFVLIGLDLSLRDKLHDLWDGDKLVLKMGGLIACASTISYVINPASGMIALASFAAFAFSMIADTFAYHKLKNKKWFIRVNGSNLAGAAVDSFVFPAIAFGGLLLHIVALQFVAKVVGGLIWSSVLKENKNQLL